MKIELIKEEQYGREPWYEIKIGDTFIKGGYILDVIIKHYEELKNNPELLKKHVEILKSDEIVVPLDTNLKQKTDE